MSNTIQGFNTRIKYHIAGKLNVIKKKLCRNKKRSRNIQDVQDPNFNRRSRGLNFQYGTSLFYEAMRKIGITSNDFVKGSKMFNSAQGYKYRIKFQNSGKLSIIDTTLRGKNNWVLRLDKPHGGAQFNHININSKISGIKDPHLQLPPGGIELGNLTAQISSGINYINKVMVPIAIAFDTARTCHSAYNDYNNNTTRNTIETVSNIAASWGGGYAGAVSGAAVGSAILPGIGTIFGGICGALMGGIGGSVTASKLTEQIGDQLNYDLIEKECKICNELFKIRKYCGEDCSQIYCAECNEYEDVDDIKDITF